jgi:hypothetical protein
VQDDGGAGDARSDGNASTNADAWAPCGIPSTTAFCDDFDEGVPLGKWDTVISGAGFGATLDTTLASSRPNSLLARIDKSVSSSCTYARVEKVIDGRFTHWRLAFTVRAEGPETLTTAAIAAVNIAPDQGSCTFVEILLNWTGTDYALALGEQAPSGGSTTEKTHTTNVRIPKGTWQRLDVEVDYVSKEIRVRDGAGVESFHGALDFSCAGPGPASLLVGFHCAAAEPITQEVRVDDVAFQAQ